MKPFTVTALFMMYAWWCGW